MIERTLSVRKGLEEVTARNRDLRDLDLSDAEWALVKEAMEFLEPFALTTKHLEAFKCPTLSAVIPLFNKLMGDMEEWSNNTRHSEESRAGANAAFEKLNNLNGVWDKYKGKPIDPTMFVVNNALPEEPQSKKYVDIIYKFKAPRVRHQEKLEDYLSIGPEDGHENVLLYWKQHANQWPNLSIMARDYLAATATSASSERGFSTNRATFWVSQDTE
ncbi:hypothetical protein DAPPUDRAFT_329813 [Daphnia pulex]|uniref:HAT C-terminal dimerisation domain-containing protein n=1 Tax=Daphnia pulex TaxID=6669 RepID=E9HHP3_DAPPU|nr:hypothetical protein DAPPUDRAFT_329813 [Daphnia pulex]|eukprot:EFX68740.1 hypothetical protein DAPPUDRAFT_329813 [Daphnia pulex]